MTDNKSYREKGRAVFLAAMIVLSVVAGSAALVGTAAANVDSGTDLNGETFWEGEEIHIDKLNGADIGANDEVEIRTNNDEAKLVRQTEANENGILVLDTSRVGSGSFEITNIDTTTDDSATFSVNTQDLNAEFLSDSTYTDGSATLELDSIRNGYEVEITHDDLDASEVTEIVEGAEEGEDGAVVSDVEDIEEIAFNFDGQLETGTQEFQIEVTDTGATATASVDLEEAPDRAIYFQGNAEGDIGNNAQISVIDETGADELWVTVGDEERSGYEVDLVINTQDVDSDQEEIILEMDTSQAGSEGNDGEVWSSPTEGVDNADITVHPVSADYEPPLVAQNYILEVGTDYDGDATKKDSAFLTLNERQSMSEDALSTWTAPMDATPSEDVETVADLQNDLTLTQTDEIAIEDQLILTVENPGIFAEDTSLNGDNNNVKLEIEGEPGPQGDVDTWTVNNADLEASIVDENASTLAFVIDTSDADQIEAGEEFDVTFTITESSTFTADDETETATTTFNVNERSIEFSNDPVEMTATDGATANGTTTVAPGTEGTSEADAPGMFFDTDTFTVEEGDDGANVFSVEYDLGEAEAGTEFDLSADIPVPEGDDAVNHEVTATITEETAPPVAETEVSFGQDDYPVTQGNSTDVTVDVTAGANGLDAATVSLTLNGEEIDNQKVTADAESSTQAVFTINASDLEVDSHSLTASVDNASDEATLTVEEPTKKGDSDTGDSDTGDSDTGDSDTGDSDTGDSDTGDSDTGDSDTGDSDTGDSDTGDSDSGQGQPGFGITVAIISLLGAALLAFRKNE